MIDFSGYTREAIQEDMLDQVPDNLDKRQGSMIQTAIGPVAWYLEGLYMTLNQVQQNAYADTAVGQALDYICAERGVYRNQAIPAVRQGTFNVEIPAGSTFKTINGANSVIFVSGDQVQGEGQEGQYVYRMTCQVPGEIGNSYSGNILPITAISGLTSAVIGKILVSGTEEETDDSLRARYRASFQSVSFGGNIAAYRSAILAIAGVGAVQVYPAWQGGGTVLCSILDAQLTPAEPGLIEQVQNTICPPEDGESTPSANGYGMAPIGAAVTITTATALTLNITCDIQFTSGADAPTYQQQIEGKIQEYLDTVCATWGNALTSQKVEYNVDVYISRIIAAILTIDQVVNVTNLQINGSASDLSLTETSALQQIPVLGTVVINGGS